MISPIREQQYLSCSTTLSVNFGKKRTASNQDAFDIPTTDIINVPTSQEMSSNFSVLCVKTKVWESFFQ